VRRKWVVGAVVGVAAVVGGVVAGVALLGEEEPMRLTSVCTGEGTQTVRCTWIPLDEELRTDAERELAAR